MMVLLSNFKWWTGFLLAIFWVILIHSFSKAEVTEVAPERNVLIEKKEEKGEKKPSWKIVWDLAREQARSQDLEAAKATYQQLVQAKPNIVEARWEYCKLLILTSEWGDASLILEGLLELEPNNLEYLIAAGNTALRNAFYNKAVKYFGQVYETNPFGEYSKQALHGLIQGISLLGNHKSALLLLEQYHLRYPNDTETLVQLAQISAKAGDKKRAKIYYSQLVDLFPDKQEYVLAAGKLYDNAFKDKRAEIYWKKYLTYDDDYLPFHKSLSNFYLATHQYEQAIPHLLKQYKSDKLSAELALQIAEIFQNELNRPDRALLYYEQASEGLAERRDLFEQIEGIRNDLANQYLPIVENNGTERLWQDLDLITMNKKILFEKMALLLEKEEKKELEAEVLSLLHDNYADDMSIVLRLADIKMQLEDYFGSLQLYEKILPHGRDKNEYLLAKAEVEMHLGKEIQALTTLNEYRKYNPNHLRANKRALELAGELGLMQNLDDIWHEIPKNLSANSGAFDLQLTFIEALRKNGLYSRTEAMYDKLIEDLEPNSKNYAEVQFYRADSLLEQNLIFESEQVIRQVLARDIYVNKAIEKLIDLSIVEKQFQRARSWLFLLRGRLEEQGERGAIVPSLLELDILIAEEEYSEAKGLLDEIRDEFKNTADSSVLSSKLDIYDVRIDYFNINDDVLLVKLEKFLANGTNNQEFLVLYDLLTVTDDDGSQKALRKAKEAGAVTFLELLIKSKYYAEYNSVSRSLYAIDLALEIIEDSTRAKIEKIKTLSYFTRYEEALELLNKMTLQFPQEEYLANLQLELEFKSGYFQKIVERVAKSKTKEKKEVHVAQENGGDINFWEKLLLARALWADNKREEAIQVYDSLLAAPVDTMFLEKVEVEKINFHLPPLKKSFWNVITFTNPPQPDPMVVVMDPKFVAQNRGKPVDDIAASMYGKYRWQKLIRKELSARKAVEQRDYYRAEKEYLSLLKEEKSEESLFDLANIYKRLGLYGKEGELYEMVKEKSPLYPGLDEYINANVLKRQPRISTKFFSDHRKGRDNYINIKKKGVGAEGWYTPTYDQEISLSVFQHNYESYDLDTTARSHRIIGTYSTYFKDSLDLNLSFGSNQLDDGGTTEPLFKVEIKGRLNKSVDAYGRYEQDVVEDNIQAVIDSIIYQDLEAGIKYDLFPRLFAGLDYRFRLYSDDNKQNRFKIWSTYHLFGEKNQFKIKYSYEDIRNTDENLIEDGSIKEEDQIDRVYWSPKHYWQHLFTLHFNHLFEGVSKPDSPLSYLSFDYSLGYEEGSSISHDFDVNIFLEINRHFLLKGNLGNLNGDDYDETTAGFSLIYRW